VYSLKNIHVIHLYIYKTWNSFLLDISNIDFLFKKIEFFVGMEQKRSTNKKHTAKLRHRSNATGDRVSIIDRHTNHQLLPNVTACHHRTSTSVDHQGKGLKNAFSPPENVALIKIDRQELDFSQSPIVPILLELTLTSSMNSFDWIGLYLIGRTI